MSEVKDDNWGDETALGGKGNPYFHLDTVGQKCSGYLMKKSIRLDEMKSKDGKEVWQRVYTIQVPEGKSYKASSGGQIVDVSAGELMDVYGRMPVDLEGKKVNIISGMEDVPSGRYVGFHYSEQRKPEEKGHQGAKIVVGHDLSSRLPDLVIPTAVDGSEAHF